jgi:uncharacterized protein YccT (UPF0319 family)
MDSGLRVVDESSTKNRDSLSKVRVLVLSDTNCLDRPEHIIIFSLNQLIRTTSHVLNRFSPKLFITHKKHRHKSLISLLPTKHHQRSPKRRHIIHQIHFFTSIPKFELCLAYLYASSPSL